MVLRNDTKRVMRGEPRKNAGGKSHSPNAAQYLTSEVEIFAFASGVCRRWYMGFFTPRLLCDILRRVASDARLLILAAMCLNCFELYR